MTQTTAHKQNRRQWAPITALTGLAALIVLGLGAATLLGWLAGLPWLASFGEDKIPMAPSTALFFLLYGGSLLALSQASISVRLRYVINGFAALLALASLLLLGASLANIYSPIEHLGLRISGLFQGVPMGHMSPLTAFCFLLAGLAVLTLPGLDSPRWRLPRTFAAFAFASLLSLLSFALLLAYLLGSPILQGSDLVPPALTTSLAFFLLATGLQALAALRLRTAGYWPQIAWSSSSYGLGLIMAILIGGIITAGFVSFQHEEQERREAMIQQLTAVAALKTERITAWLNDKKNHADELTANQGFATRVELWLRQGVDSEGQLIRNRLADYFRSYDYEGICLLDAAGRLIHGLGHHPPADPQLMETLTRAGQNRRVERSDLYQGSDGVIRMLWLVPILSAEDDWQDDGRPVAFVLQHIEAEHFLFPFLTVWPGESKSAETILGRREGDQALFLNPLRFAANAALNRRIPLERREVPAAQAALGREGVVTGRDYRGEPVMAHLNPVPNTPWFLVTKIDLSELYAPMRARLLAIVLVVMVLLLGAAAGIFLLWRWQRHIYGFTLISLLSIQDQQRKSELEQMVAQRTARLQELNRELKAFSYSVSHDLKAPLRGIDSYSQLLTENYPEKLDDEGRLFIRNIRQGVKRMREMIDGLLAYSRLERREMRPARANPRALAERVLADFQADLKAAGGEARLEIPAGIVALVDPDGLAMALRNLVDNAIKFRRPELAPLIVIRGELTGDCLRLEVRDNGIGFEMKMAERIFEIFTRLEKEVLYPGTGVGLALVRKAVQRMGGKVQVTSSPGQGTAFILEIPQDGASGAST